MQVLRKFHEHVVVEHRDWINSWYNENRKNFRYVKRECLKPFKNSLPIGYWLNGRAIFAEAPLNIVDKIRRASSYYELDEALEQIERSNAFFATKLQARILREWLVSYVLKKEAKITVEMGRG